MEKSDQSKNRTTVIDIRTIKIYLSQKMKRVISIVTLICIATSCIIVERNHYEERTGLEWIYREYRNGEQSFTAAGETIRGVDFENHGFGLFSLYSDCYTIYHATNDTIYRIMDIPKKADDFIVGVVGQNWLSPGYPYSSANKDFVIEIEYWSNENYHTYYYHSDGKYFTESHDYSWLSAVNVDNEYHSHDYIDYYLFNGKEEDKVFNTNGDIIISVKGAYIIDGRHKFWNLTDKISNSYYFIVNHEDEDGNDYQTDIFSKTGDFILSIDVNKEIYITNGRQYDFSDWKEEYISYEELVHESFRGSNFYTIKVDKNEDTYYYLTKVDNAFYILRSEEYLSSHMESVCIPMQTSPIKGKEEGSKESASSNIPTYSPEYGQRDVWVQCAQCHGSGKCWSCQGDGWCVSTRSDGSYNSTYQCPICHGTGRCTTCYGTGGHYEKQQYQIR